MNSKNNQISSNNTLSNLKLDSEPFRPTTVPVQSQMPLANQMNSQSVKNLTQMGYPNPGRGLLS